MWITRVSISKTGFHNHGDGRDHRAGFFSYQRLRVEQMPDVSLPYVYVQTDWPGASPEAVKIRTSPSRSSTRSTPFPV